MQFSAALLIWCGDTRQEGESPLLSVPKDDSFRLAPAIEVSHIFLSDLSDAVGINSRELAHQVEVMVVVQQPIPRVIRYRD